MAKDEESPEFQQDSGSVDDVEILEVVGVDVDSPATSGGGKGPAPDEEFLLSFDEEAEAEARGEEPAGEPAEPLPASAGPRATAADQDALLRLRADYDNLRKRIDRERHEFENNANFSLVGELLPVLDNFERALAIDPPEGAGEAFREGFFLIYKQLNDQLRREGLRVIEALGQPFDPNVHDAVATDSEADAPSNTVVEELRRGYLFQDRVLRPAMVKVSMNGSCPSDPGQAGEDS